jgi:S-adenosylmethionine:tRNA ribosyltransferase-isomerase
MKLSDFDFDLPEHLIAVRPAVPRTSAKLLVADQDTIADHHVSDLTEVLRPGDRLVLNNTKVIPARLTGIRCRTGETGEATRAKIELTLLSPTPQGDWRCLIKPLKKVKEGEEIRLSEGFAATLLQKADGQGTVRFNVQGAAFDRALAEVGAMPLPPYIAAKRQADEQDKTDYQTVFARETGAVAAPTASLHFDEALLEKLRAKGVMFSQVTLHVGAGTFLPVKVDDIADHKMHAEWGQVTEEAAAEILETKANGGRVVPVGTTALRLIETAAHATGQIKAWTGETDIFIMPGFQFKVTDALMTNFHLPKSTLMMLVSALMGADRIRQIYDHAIGNAYRFFSYGDSSLLVPKPGND